MSDGQAPLAGDDVSRRFLPCLYRKDARLVVLGLSQVINKKKVITNHENTLSNTNLLASSSCCFVLFRGSFCPLFLLPLSINNHANGLLQ